MIEKILCRTIGCSTLIPGFRKRGLPWGYSFCVWWNFKRRGLW